jgi:formylglycine-generating enzyme required for sulfatase activity
MPRHSVTIAQPFAAGKFEITFDEWDACVRERGCKHNPGDDGWGRGRRPVINVSWNDAKQYTQWLSAKAGKTYRLLSEAEWEYVARAGVTTPIDKPEMINSNQAGKFTHLILPTGLTGIKQQTLPVGSFQPNAFGLYDLHSNAWEWTEDCWNASYFGAPANGAAWTSGDCSRRALRGGSWSYRRGLRSADRGGESVHTRSGLIGFRVARTL